MQEVGQDDVDDTDPCIGCDTVEIVISVDRIARQAVLGGDAARFGRIATDQGGELDAGRVAQAWDDLPQRQFTEPNDGYADAIAIGKVELGRGRASTAEPIDAADVPARPSSIRSRRDKLICSPSSSVRRRDLHLIGLSAVKLEQHGLATAWNSISSIRVPSGS